MNFFVKCKSSWMVSINSFDSGRDLSWVGNWWYLNEVGREFVGFGKVNERAHAHCEEFVEFLDE